MNTSLLIIIIGASIIIPIIVIGQIIINNNEVEGCTLLLDTWDELKQKQKTKAVMEFRENIIQLYLKNDCAKVLGVILE